MAPSLLPNGGGLFCFFAGKGLTAVKRRTVSNFWTRGITQQLGQYIVTGVKRVIGWGWVIVLCWVSYLLGILTMGRLSAASRALDEADRETERR
ncbi:hypothetical protein EDC14_105114 [Hydrogenispora ethanolica]|jgi:hypothetical protein|uniref:Uncharacterized protein n=1 Tax=Hydrogenispora ethanolica TaxID=1082276 RepID=A0A4R1QSX2_HYDET|nr:hypothetical protein EDC14_105114 [Hydrogenispora ethanolica]